MGSLGKGLGKVGSALKSAFVVAGIAAGADAIVGFMKDSVTSASDLNETISKTNVLFGKSAPEIMKWAENASTAMGMSKNEALTGVSAFGNFFNQIGIGTKQSVKMSESLVKMSADLASFNNAKPQEVMEALQSATRGEYDALQKYIPTISAATVQNEALRETHKKSVKDLTDAEKATALYNLALKGQGKAAGDFARTQGGLANQQRILSAQWADFKTVIGSALLPVITTFVTFLNQNLIPTFKAIGNVVGPIFGKIRDAFKALFEVGTESAYGFGEIMDNIFGNSGKLIPAFTVVGNVIKSLVLGFKALFSAFKDGDVTSDGFVGKMEGMGVFIKTQVIPAIQGIVDKFKVLVAVVVPIVVQVVQAIVANWSKIAPYVNQVFTAIKQIIVGVLGIIKQVIVIVTAAIKFVWERWGSDIMSFVGKVFKAIFQIIGGLMKAIAGVVKLVLALIRGDWSGAWNALKQIVSGVWQAIKGIVSGALTIIKGILSGAWGVIKAVAQAAWNGVKAVVAAALHGLVGQLKAAPGQFRAALGNLGGVLKSAGRALIQGLIDGITDMIGSVKRKLSELTNLIPDWKGPASKDAKLLFKSGQLIIGGLIDGIDKKQADLKKTLTGVTQTIANTNMGTLDAGLAFAGSGASAFGGETNVYINVEVSPTADKAAVGREIQGALDEWRRLNG